MKVKNKELKLQNNLEGKNGLLEPKKVLCSNCKKNLVFIRFVIPRQAFSQKNNLGHWTEKDKDKKKEWCNQCVLELFHNKPLYWQVVKSQKRRGQMRKYIYDGKFAD